MFKEHCRGFGGEPKLQKLGKKEFTWDVKDDELLVSRSLKSCASCVFIDFLQLLHLLSELLHSGLTWVQIRLGLKEPLFEIIAAFLRRIRVDLRTQFRFRPTRTSEISHFYFRTRQCCWVNFSTILQVGKKT